MHIRKIEIYKEIKWNMIYTQHRPNNNRTTAHLQLIFIVNGGVNLSFFSDGVFFNKYLNISKEKKIFRNDASQISRN